MADRFRSTERRRCPRDHCGREVLVNADGSLRAHRKPMGKGYVGITCRDPLTGNAYAIPEAAAKIELELWPLSDRELGIVRYLADGLTYGQIARRMHLSEWTVKTQAGKARKASGAETNCQLVAIVMRSGQLEEVSGG